MKRGRTAESAQVLSEELPRQDRRPFGGAVAWCVSRGGTSHLRSVFPVVGRAIERSEFRGRGRRPIGGA